MNNLNRFSAFFGFVSSLCSYLGAFYYLACFTLLCLFLLLRIPFIYGGLGFAFLVVFFIFPSYVSLFIGRVEDGISLFLSSLVPSGTPLWIAPFVGLAETISYIVRPAVLMIRPFLNITIGALGASSLAGMTMSNCGLVVFLIFVFFYEVFVAIVHWFIVVNILGFSEDH
uniref:ATP synthase F0 subunit 6 n=1 Tax=Scutogyrus longicornis TaxID=341066 RepID=A0A888YTI6_9PLAT|nr:ATP synthase F0 subunit 6 [Scutogyrus longicornis]QRC77980.1 ATP synthase F0 subunit 6 [Scutogyrus longicornis]